MVKEVKQEKLTNDILMFQLQERYHSMHVMRERIQTLSLRIMWILLWVSWWLTQNKLTFDCCERNVAILLTCILFGIFIDYFADLKKGFNKQMNIAKRLESELWLFEWENPILKEFKDNERAWKRNAWKYQYLLMWFWFLVLFICILYFT